MPPKSKSTLISPLDIARLIRLGFDEKILNETLAITDPKERLNHKSIVALNTHYQMLLKEFSSKEIFQVLARSGGPKNIEALVDNYYTLREAPYSLSKDTILELISHDNASHNINLIVYRSVADWRKEFAMINKKQIIRGRFRALVDFFTNNTDFIVRVEEARNKIIEEYAEQLLPTAEQLLTPPAKQQLDNFISSTQLTEEEILELLQPPYYLETPATLSAAPGPGNEVSIEVVGRGSPFQRGQSVQGRANFFNSRETEQPPAKKFKADNFGFFNQAPSSQPNNNLGPLPTVAVTQETSLNEWFQKALESYINLLAKYEWNKEEQVSLLEKALDLECSRENLSQLIKWTTELEDSMNSFATFEL